VTLKERQKTFDAATRSRLARDFRRQRKQASATEVEAHGFVEMLETLVCEVRIRERPAKSERRDLEAARRAVVNAARRFGLLSRYAVAHIASAAFPALMPDDFRAHNTYARGLSKLIGELEIVGAAIKQSASSVRSKRRGSKAFPELAAPRLVLARRVVDVIRIAGIVPTTTKGGFTARCLKEVFVLAGAEGNLDGYVAKALAGKGSQRKE